MSTIQYNSDPFVLYCNTIHLVLVNPAWQEVWPGGAQWSWLDNSAQAYWEQGSADPSQ
jgi:hypothetical protein